MDQQRIHQTEDTVISMKFDKTLNINHLLVFLGLMANAAALLSDAVRWRERTDQQMMDHQRRIVALEATVAKLTENVYWLRENVVLLSELVKRHEQQQR